MTDKTTLERIRELAIPPTREARTEPDLDDAKVRARVERAVLDLLCDEDLPDA